MATLNLRTVKTNKTSKGKSSAPETLPDDFLRLYKVDPHTTFYSFTDKVRELEEAITLEDQMNLFKQLVRQAMHETNLEEHKSLEFIVLLFLHLNSNSSLKTRFLKLLMEQSKDKNLNLSFLLFKIFSANLMKLKNKHHIIVKNIVNLLEYFDKKSDMLLKSYAVIIAFVKNLIESGMEKLLCSEMSAVEKSSIFESIHDCFRVLLIIIQTESSITSLQTEDFFRTLESILYHVEIPVDIKSNCALFLVRLTLKTGGEESCASLFFSHCKEVQGGNVMVKTCLCAGFLNVFSLSQLNTIHVDNGKFNSSLLHLMVSLLFEMSELYVSDSNSILIINRAIHLLARGFSKHPEFLTSNICEYFLNYIWIHIEHFMDSVRHTTKFIFEYFISFKTDKVNIIFLTLKSLKKARLTSKFFCVGIQLVSRYVETNKLLDEFPVFIKSYIQLVEDTPASTYLVSAVETILCGHLNYVSTEEWVSSWIIPILLALNKKKSSALEQVLSRAIKFAPQIIPTIISCKEPLPLYCILLCLYTGSKNGLVQDDCSATNHDKWKGVVDYNVLSKATYHQDEEVRLLTFFLLIENKKTTQVFNCTEFNLLLQFLTYNLNNQNSSFRQKVLSGIKKFMHRFNASFFILQRNQDKETLMCNSEEMIHQYNTFKINLINICEENLFPGANFGRRFIVLSVLKIGFEMEFFTDCVFSKTFIETLILYLNDSYEDNKVIAQYILKMILSRKVNSEKEEDTPLQSLLNCSVDTVFEICHKLISSTHPSDCATAGYLIEFLTNTLEQTEETNVLSLSCSCESVSSVCQVLKYSCLSKIASLLQTQVKVAECNIFEAALNGPMYGAIFVIRHLLLSVDLREVSLNLMWQAELLNIIEVCFRASKSVSVIVNNLSPEGHLPMDFTAAKEDESNLIQVTSQMLLLCAWRTVKEVSLLFGEMIERSAIGDSENNKEGFLSDELLLRIGAYFMQSLSEIKHRGAFEQAYIGFSKFCLTLWKCPSKTLSELPMKWLEEMMQEITRANNKLCSTRRSAGVPFIIQTLLCTEHQVSPSAKCFHSAMNQLLRICETDETTLESKIHALNILRSLFRSTELGDQVNLYVARGVKISVLGFASSNWSERNSSTLLLSALLVRIFGVPRSKESLSWKNKMTGRIFFMRYPSLYEFFLSELKSFDSENPTVTHQTTLFPILLILARIYPSSLEGTDSNLQLAHYIPYVNNACRSPIYEVRVLAANAITSLITKLTIKTFVESLVSMFNAANCDNIKHGLLLQLNQIILNQSEIDDEVQRFLCDWIDQNFCKILGDVSTFVVKETFLKLVFYSISKCGLKVKFSFLSVVREKIISNCTNVEKIVGKNNFNVIAVSFVLFNFFVNYSLYDSENKDLTSKLSKITIDIPDRTNLDENPLYSFSLSKCIDIFMASKNFDIQDTVLTFVFYTLLISNNTNADFNLPKTEFEDLKAFLVINHDTAFFTHVVEQLKQYKILLDIPLSALFDSNSLPQHKITYLRNKMANSKCDLILHKYLANLRFLPQAIDFFGDGSTSELSCLFGLCFNENDNSVCVQALHCISSYFSYKVKKQCLPPAECVNQLCSILFSEGSVMKHSDQIRWVFAEILANNFMLFIRNASTVNLLNLLTAVIDLLQDDIIEIREKVACILESTFESTKNLELMLEEFRTDPNINNLSLATVLSAKILKDIDYNAFGDKKVDRIFGESNMNIFFEDIVLTRFAANCLSSLFCDDPSLAKIILPDEAKDWLCNYCDFDLNIKLNLAHVFNAVISKLRFKQDSLFPLILNSSLRQGNSLEKIIFLKKLDSLQKIQATIDK